MKNFISPSNHPESYLSGSTIDSMIDKTKQLGLDYISITDNGHLMSILKSYSLAQKKDIKIIPGIELFFKDSDCPIVKNTPSEHVKYFKIIVHFKDQQAYQKMVRMVSDETRSTINIRDNVYPLFNWSDLEELSNYNVTVCTSDIEGMVTKHLLVDRADLGLKYFQKLKSLFNDNLYLSIIPYMRDKYQNAIVKIKLNEGKTIELPANSRIILSELKKDKWVSYGRHYATDLIRFKRNKKKLKAITVNHILHKIKDQYQDVQGTELSNEFQNIGLDLQYQANKFILALANKFNLQDRLLISSYSYYSNEKDKVVQDMRLGEKTKIYQKMYVCSTQEAIPYLEKSLKLSQDKIRKMVDNSHQWVKNFENFKLKYNYRLPTVEGNKGPKELLIDIINKNGRMKWHDPVYLKRFRGELELLTNNGVLNLIPYFLPIVAIYKYYKDNGYLTGPARGSAGGFLISYLLGITHIDPIKYGLSSARFLTLDRVQQGNLPDIDCDMEDRAPLVGKDGNSGFLFKKYQNRAAQVSTRTLLRIKSAILDTNRYVNGEVEEDVARFSKSLPTTPQGINDKDFIFGYKDQEGNHIKGLLEKNKYLQRYATNRPKEWDIITRALSLSRQNSRHPCSFLIADCPIEDVVPLMEVGGVKRVTQPEHKQCEEAGLIKYDFLVVSALKDINLCLNYINKKNNTLNIETGHFIHEGVNTYIWDLPENQEVFKSLSEGKTESVFQLSTVSVKPFIKKIKPKSITDCAIITALVRPGPLDFIDKTTRRNMAEEYVYRRTGLSRGKIKVLNEMLPQTYGIICFQEDVSKIAKEFAGMSVIDAENVRIGMGKKKIKLLNSLKPKFIEGACKNTNEETAEMVWSMMATFARYGFNKSHATAYSVISYACAFLKHHYPLEWWAAVLSNATDKEINEVYYKYVRNILLPPDINISTEQLSIDYTNNKIRHKLSALSGVGNKLANKMVENRPYIDLKNFIQKKVCGNKMAKKLIHVGVLDSLFDSDAQTTTQKITKYNQVLHEIETEEKINKTKKQIEIEKDEKKLKRLNNKLEKLSNETSSKYFKDDFVYFGASMKKDFLMKKSVFPTMNLDLMPILMKDSKFPIIKGSVCPMIEFGKNTTGTNILTGERFQAIDERTVESEFIFCVPGYVIDCGEFSFHKNTKKALKIIVDSSGYISERVIWPDYNTGQLYYPDTFKKGCLAWFIYKKTPFKLNTKLINVIIEEESIL